ncbi:hypothetical protein E3E12_04735 [Formicincola oecophyllae]|uniref:Trm112 family protein n=2 Tax=Formicincola oecophyllae TaxID=2558361 RepID=A0A4Y6UA64_9PROT|nr:Trm112 family protein [Formicincola oecophyllae]QDH14389.1 hypothetical protein E3E12_04735 [Formicincola oecophyllae]
MAPTSEQGTAHVLPPDERLLKLLVCPVTGGPVHFDADFDNGSDSQGNPLPRGAIISPQARLAFRVEETIPIMLADEARPF